MIEQGVGSVKVNSPVNGRDSVIDVEPDWRKAVPGKTLESGTEGLS